MLLSPSFKFDNFLVSFCIKILLKHNPLIKI